MKEVWKTLNCKVDKEGMWKFVGILVVLLGIIWTASYNIYTSDVEKREKNINANTIKTIVNSERISNITIDLQYLKDGQKKLEDKFDKTTSILLMEIRRGK